jgi:Flp pilus assembly protein TadG
MKKAIKHHRGDQGTQIVELAIVLPLLVFLALAVSEGAGMIRAHQVVNNAAREGARFAILSENSPAAMDPNNPQFVTNCTTTPTHPVCQAIAIYAQNNGISSGTGLGKCGGPSVAMRGLNVTVNQAVLIPNGASNIPGSQVTVICPYSLKFMPKVPTFGITGTVNLKGAVVFRNFFN